jgi:hypothetical protein
VGDNQDNPSTGRALAARAPTPDHIRDRVDRCEQYAPLEGRRWFTMSDKAPRLKSCPLPDG